MYEKYCDTYYQTQVKQLAFVKILTNPNKIPELELKDYPVTSKGHQDFVVDNHGGAVKLQELELYNIKFK